ncbi:MAG: SdiA-regulated domain-containing protein [Pedobacter sp.]|nr:SdiA-regulated domain-containing protein [Pedobacter sp.]
MKKYSNLGFAGLFVLSLVASSCAQKKSKAPASPANYDINKPTKYRMPDILQEISGIAFDRGDNKIVYAQQDEDGDLFSLPLDSKEHTRTKFAEKGDYEDVAILNGWAILLKSNGTLFTFPLTEVKLEETTNVKENKDLVPKGEYEGVYADEGTKKVYLLCKTCKQDKGTKKASGYVLDLNADGTLKPAGNFTVDAGQMDKLAGKKKGAFHPSALALNPITKEWYIVSSVNKALLVADQKWALKAVYHLSSNIYNQPEGIAFDKQGNLYISNEGSETQVGNILRFDYKK